MLEPLYRLGANKYLMHHAARPEGEEARYDQREREEQNHLTLVCVQTPPVGKSDGARNGQDDHQGKDMDRTPLTPQS